MQSITDNSKTCPQIGQDDGHASIMDSYKRHLYARFLSDATIKSMCSQAHTFLTHIEADDTVLAAITRVDTAEYWVAASKTHGHSSMRNVRVGLASFLRWLAQSGIIQEDLSLALPSVVGRVTRIKSLYTSEEVASVLTAIDRTDALGKRDYAMMLFGAAFALRAKDVIELKVADIDWTHSKITIVLHKTKRLHTMELPPAVGNAILDYLINGRPDSDSPCLFLVSRPPYQGFSSSGSCAGILGKYIRRAGVDPCGRATGFHVFRGRAASELLSEGMPLSIISSYLGHAHPDSIRSYISVDERGMRSCCLSLNDIEARR